MASKNPLTKKAIITHLNVRQFSGVTTDRTPLAAVAKQFHSETTGDKYLKSLFTTNALAETKLQAGRARTNHYQFSVPWLDGAGRLIFHKHLPEFQPKHKQIKHDFDKAALEFAEEYPQLVQKAKEVKGDLFNPNEYPAADTILSRFSIRLNVLPFPDSADFRLDCADEEIKELRKQLDDNIPTITSDVVRSVGARVAERAKKILDGMSKGKNFTRTHLDQMATVLPFIDCIPGIVPEEFIKMRERIENEFLCYEAEQIRENETLANDIHSLMVAAVKAYTV